MNKTILITGASSGIGKACAEYLAAKGYTVYGTSRKPATESTSTVRMLQMDVTQAASVQAGIDTIMREQGTIDAVINNAGMGIAGAAELATAEEIQQQMQTNFMGTVTVCQAVLPHMRRTGSGKIINISSLAGSMAIPFQGFYSASKFAIEGYSEALSMEVQPFHIHVSVVEPGDFRTGFTASRLVSDATACHPDYASRFKRCMAIIEKEETGGCPPAKLARKLHKIIRTTRPHFRYRVGNVLQVTFTKAKAIVPSRWHQRLLRVFYGLRP